MITKDNFNKLEILEQIKLINELILNDSLTNICKSIGIDRATIRKRFKGVDYIYNKSINQYVKEEVSINTVNTVNTVNTSNKNEVDINTLIKQLKALEGRVKDLENTINTINTNTVNTINTIKIKEFKGDTETRAYRIYKDVQKDFKTYCKRHSEHKVQDIISSALVEFMENNG